MTGRDFIMNLSRFSWWQVDVFMMTCRDFLVDRWKFYLFAITVKCRQIVSPWDLQSQTFYFFFSIWVFFHEHSRFPGQQGKGEGIYLTPLYNFHPLHRHLDISRAIAAESSPLRIVGSWTRTGNLWFPSASH